MNDTLLDLTPDEAALVYRALAVTRLDVEKLTVSEARKRISFLVGREISIDEYDAMTQRIIVRTNYGQGQ